MIVDFHTHIFPEIMRSERQRYFADEPGFELLYRRSDSKMAGVRELIDTMDRHKIDKSVIFGFPWKNPETYRRHNDYIKASMDKYPERLIGFSCFDPFGEASIIEAQRCLEKGFSGVGELAHYQSGFDSSAIASLAPIMELCRQKNMPVLLHANEPVGCNYPGKAPLTLRQICSLIDTYPDNRIVLAHWGGGIFFYHLAKRKIKESLKNVYFDTAASPFLYEPAIYNIAVQIIGKDKILFGSDFPLLMPGRYFKELEISGLAGEEIENICGNNAARLLNL